MNNQNLEAKKLEILQEQLTVHREQDKRAGMLLQFAMILTGLLYFMFEKHLFLGDAVTWGSYFATWHGAADFVLTFIIVVMSAIFLAWVKHHAYLHFGLYGSITLIVVTVIGFALFAEFFSQSASQDTKSRVLLSNDAAYQATITQPNAAPTQFIGGSNTEIAKAEQTYARCMKNLGKPGYPHCNGDKANLDSLKSQESTRLSIARDVAIQSNIETEKLRNERQDKLKADSYNPVIVSIAKMLAAVFGGSYTDYIKTATVLVTLIVAIAFEILHHFLSHAKERAQNAVYGLELELAKYQGSALPEKPESVIPRNDGGFKESGIGFTAPVGNKSATAKYGDSGSHHAPTGKADIDTTAPLFKYQQEPQAVNKQPFGFTHERVAPTARLDNTVSSQPAPAQRKSPVMVDGFDMAEIGKVFAPTDEEIQTGRTWRQALRNGDTVPRDMPLDATIMEADKNPVHRVSEVADTNPVHRVLDEAEKPQPATADSLYPQWVQAIQAKQCRPSVEASRGWIQKRIAPTMTGSKTNDLKRIAAMCKAFFARAIREGKMKPNPNYTNGSKKYIWIG